MKVRLESVATFFVILLLAGCASVQTMDGARSTGSDHVAEAAEVRMDAPETVGIMATNSLVGAAISGSKIGLYETHLPASLSSERTVHLWNGVDAPRRTWYGMAVSPSGEATFVQGYLPDGKKGSRMILIADKSLNEPRVVLFSTGGVFMTNLRGEKKDLPATAQAMYALGSSMTPMNVTGAKTFLNSLKIDFVAYKRRGVYTLYPKDLGKETISAAMSTNPEYTPWGRIEARGGISITPDLVGTAIATGLSAAFAAADFNPVKKILTGDGSSPRFYEGSEN